jgi:autotransporter-associated beta strand protein
MNRKTNILLTFLTTIFLELPLRALPIEVNPATPLTGTFAVEWNTASNFENWTTSGIESASVTGGALSGTTNSNDPQVSLSNFPGSPDLDLGFNDFLEIRIQVPASYANAIQIYYGTTATTGFSGARIITIPNATIPKDGAFHTYRIDVGPEPWWRATLSDLRVDLGNVSGVPFAIDYIRVGDEPSPTVYQLRATIKCPAAGGATPSDAFFGPGQAVSSMESKHFRFLWNTNVTQQSGWAANTARGTLRNLEEAWQVYVKIMGYREPAFNIGTTSGTTYKLNVTSYYDGFWAGVDDHGGTSLAQLNITTGGLQVDPPTWVVPHELMHCFQFHNTSGHVNGEWYETHANYARERWLQHYQVFYPNRSNIEALGVRDGHFMMSSGRNYYLTWPFMYYVDTNPDNLPDLSEGMIKRVWQETQPGEFPMMALDRITPTTSLKDIAGYYARRCATWDFSNQAAMTAELNGQDATRNARHFFTDLIQRPDAPTWWRVPANKAPAQGAYAMHELIPAGSGAGRVVTVNLRGLADSARGADWRASLIAVSDTGVERYTPLWSNGNSSITLAANENKLYLSVAGTPDVFHYGSHDEPAFRFRSHPSRSRFHYEVQVTGATPRERTNGSTAGLTQHSNGGGFRSVSVPASVFIGPNARVLGGTVGNNARIEDYAVVTGGTVNGTAIISGHAWVRGGTVNSNARVRDWAIVDGGTISGNARVLEHATVAANMQGTAVAKGSALHQVGGTLSGNAIVDGDYMGNNTLSGGITFGHLPFVGVPANFTTTTPAGLYAAYDFRNAHDSRALDQYGVTDAFTVGSPTWSASDGNHRGLLTFNGSNQYIALDRSVGDSRAFSFSAWVKPTAGSANQALLWLGTSSTRRLSLTTSNASGQARFSIVNSGVEQTLTGAGLAPGVWSHIAVTINGTTGVLYVNGTATASGSITLRPDQLLAENTTTGLQHNYLGRSEGSIMPMFQGSLDSAQFYSSALSAAQITALATPPAAVGDLMLSDSFTAESYDAGNFNNNLATDQQGYLAPTTYSIAGGGGWQAQHGNGGTMLLVGDSGYNSRASLNQDFALVADEFDQALAFQMDVWVDTGNDSSWSSVAIGSGQGLNADSPGAKFAIRPMRNNTLQIWVNGSQVASASRSGNNFRIILSDTAGSGSAFDGNGSKAALFNGATLVGTYTLPQLSSGDGYLTFGAQPDSGYHITRVDNLNISRVIVTPPPAILTWQGNTDSDYNTGANYTENGWGQWTDYVFDSNVVNGTLNVDDYTGWGNLSLNSGLSTDITIGGSSPIIMAPAKLGQSGWDFPSLGGTMTLASDSRNLTINTGLIIAGELVWNVGSGRTLTANGSLQNWTDNGIAALRKEGDGTAILSVSNNFSGGTIITGGTLQVGTGGTSGSLGSGAVSIASDAKLSFNRSDTLTTSQNFSGEGTIAQEGTGTLIINSDVASITHVVVNNGLLRTDFFRQWNSNLNLTVNATGVFEMWNTTTTIANLSGNGTIRNSANWSGYAAGSPAATNNLTIAAGNFTGTITDNGFGDGGTTGTTGDTRISLFKASNATLILSGNTSYGGNTTIQAGTLRLGNGTAPTNLANSADVIVAAGAMLHLDYSGTDQIRSLWVDGLQMPAGIYSSTSGFISGAGTLTVTTGPASADFAVWAGRGMHNLTGGPYADDDNDGVPNLLEYVLGGNPNAHSRAILPTTRISAGNLVFSFDRVQSTTADTVQEFEHSSNLSDWTSVPMSNEAMIHIEPDTAHVGMEKVTITIPLVNSDRLFGRLRITQSQTSSDD